MRCRWLIVTMPLVAALLIISDNASGQGPSGRPTIVTTTRLVMLSGGHEHELLSTIQNRDEPALTAILADNFEMRVASRPGEPVPRAEWIKHALASPPATWSVQHVVARDLGCAVLVSFRLEPGSAVPGARSVFVVDTWVQG